MGSLGAIRMALLKYRLSLRWHPIGRLGALGGNLTHKRLQTFLDSRKTCHLCIYTKNTRQQGIVSSLVSIFGPSKPQSPGSLDVRVDATHSRILMRSISERRASVVLWTHVATRPGTGSEQCRAFVRACK